MPCEEDSIGGDHIALLDENNVTDQNVADRYFLHCTGSADLDEVVIFALVQRFELLFSLEVVSSCDKTHNRHGDYNGYAFNPFGTLAFRGLVGTNSKRDGSCH